MSQKMKFLWAVFILLIILSLTTFVLRQYYPRPEPHNCHYGSELEESAAVMEWKTDWIECQEDIDRYVEESREIVCWDTLVDWQEQHDKEMRQCHFTYDGLMECESSLAELKREYEKQRRQCLECIVADILKVKDGSHD